MAIYILKIAQTGISKAISILSEGNMVLFKIFKASFAYKNILLKLIVNVQEYIKKVVKVCKILISSNLSKNKKFFK